MKFLKFSGGFFLVFALLNFTGYHCELLAQKKIMSFDQVLEYNYYSDVINKNCDTAQQLIIKALADPNSGPALNNKLNEISSTFIKLADFLQSHYTNDLPFNAYLENTCDKISALADKINLYKQTAQLQNIIFLIIDCAGGDLISCAGKLSGIK